MAMTGIVVGLGASIGAVLRFSVTELFDAGFWPILAINVAGSFLMGLLRPGPFWGTGVLGGFTSYSAFAALVVASTPLPAVGYLAVTVLGCLAAWLLGNRLRPERPVVVEND